MSILDRLSSMLEAIQDHLYARRLKQAEEECATSKIRVDRAQTELTQAKMEIEKAIHSLSAKSREEDFVPPFHLWIECSEIQDLNIEQAMDRYIDEYNLLLPESADEPVAVARIGARLKILYVCKEQCAKDVVADLDKYIIAQECILAMRKIKWRRDMKKHGLDAGAVF